MKTLKYIFVLIIVLSACKSMDKLVVEGNYDKAIEKGLKKVAKGKADNAVYINIDKSYQLANQRDNEQIELYIAENNPKNWDKIYHIYNRLDARQKRLRTIQPFTLNGGHVQYEQIDYATLKAESKNNAANYFYTHGKKLLGTGIKQDARSAYQEFNRARQYNESAYPDIDYLIDSAIFIGTTNVNVVVINRTRQRVTDHFVEGIYGIDVSSLENFWVKYHIDAGNQPIPFDTEISVQIQNIIFSSEKESEKEYEKKKKVEDGYRIMKDRNGKPKLDSLGNERRIPIYKELSCKYVETRRYKDLIIKYKVEYFDINAQSIRKSIPSESTLVFEHYSAMALGDEEALDKIERARAKTRPENFPANVDMLNDISAEIAANVQTILNSNKNLIR